MSFFITVINKYSGDQFLRARGYATAATLTEAAYASITARVTELMEQSIRASTTDQSTIVQICAIRAFQKYALTPSCYGSRVLTI